MLSTSWSLQILFAYFVTCTSVSATCITCIDLCRDAGDAEAVQTCLNNCKGPICGPQPPQGCSGKPEPVNVCATYQCEDNQWIVTATHQGVKCTVGSKAGACSSAGVCVPGQTTGSASSPSLSATNWTPIGPAPVQNTGTGGNNAGRINVAAADPTDPAVIFIAAAGGGIWKTTNGTAAAPQWQPLTDAIPASNAPPTNLASLQVASNPHALSIHPANHNLIQGVVYNSGAGVLVSSREGRRRLGA